MATISQAVADLLGHFPDAMALRYCGADAVYADRELAPHCGFMSLRESAILLAEAQRIGGDWLEIGAHVAWSTAVIASATCSVVSVDPQYGHEAQPDVRKRAVANLSRAGLLESVSMIGVKSETFFADWKAKFNGILIDGCHDAPEPLKDAQGAMACLNLHGVIVLHDFNGQPIKDAVAWLAGQGFLVETYDTVNGLAICRK